MTRKNCWSKWRPVWVLARQPSTRRMEDPAEWVVKEAKPPTTSVRPILNSPIPRLAPVWQKCSERGLNTATKRYVLPVAALECPRRRFALGSPEKLAPRRDKAVPLAPGDIHAFFIDYPCPPLPGNIAPTSLPPAHSCVTIRWRRVAACPIRARNAGEDWLMRPQPTASFTVDPTEQQQRAEQEISEIEGGEVRTASTVEDRDGHLCVFLPPVETLEDHLELVAAAEQASKGWSTYAGAVPRLSAAPRSSADRRPRPSGPGKVIEVNIHPAANWQERVLRPRMRSTRRLGPAASVPTNS